LPCLSILQYRDNAVRTLKLLVIVMGVMLVAGVAILIVTVAGRVSRNGAGLAGSPPFAAPSIDLPQGARIETMAVASDRLVIDVVLADGTRQLLVLDLVTGRRLGTIPLRTTP
jgi:hypothetical protein